MLFLCVLSTTLTWHFFEFAWSNFKSGVHKFNLNVYHIDIET